jgi:hypothetical protein
LRWRGSGHHLEEVAVPAPSRLIVARFRDGRTVKGSTHDFSPEKDYFHIYPMADEKQKALGVPIGSLKAIFFVRSLKGNRYHIEDNTFRTSPEQGRRILITFQDGEEIAGVAPGSVTGQIGFFILPADPRSNNLRIFVVKVAVADIAWPDVTSPRPGRSAASGRGR